MSRLETLEQLRERDDTFAPSDSTVARLEKLDRTVTFVPSQIGAADQVPVSYTSDPGRLLWYDLKLFASKLTKATGVFLPLRVGRDAQPYDELYPSVTNIWSCVLHTILGVNQGMFLCSLPWYLFAPVFWLILYVIFFFLINAGICRLLNGSDLKIYPTISVDPRGQFRDEYWIFMNGVSVGRGWLQANVNRLSQTFGRRVVGVHNPSDGIVFDLIQCVIQRNFSYSTSDVREAYLSIKEALLDKSIKKVVFILHSQGGIEGGLIMDWLFAECSRFQLRRMEIYTFGCAANHFNNPDYHETDGDQVTDGKCIEHIEHYANLGDFVSQIGVLNYTRVANRYMGRLFLSPDSGHLLNQHYLHTMFHLGQDGRVAENNPFMDLEVRVNYHDLDPGHEQMASFLTDRSGGVNFGSKMKFLDRGDAEKEKEAIAGQHVAFVGDVNRAVRPMVLLQSGQEPRRMFVKDFSRLWQYRNGGSPPDEPVKA
ncbi:hypothetical protein EJ08DRAFT_100039 [Tothia fuscella]|uniref:DUF676 domain-containing protein n=1 Tax=Tothia fuscella TaxID=1048955 RepID=A0A9P4NW84_9PEZI|nr:hypothetical protein EJ08DRAFT_100039 [Tothia fuscella]